MKKTLRIGILASTKGTSMQVLINAINDGALNAEIVVVISDKEDAYALKRAEKYHIPAIFLNPKDKTREEYGDMIMATLEEYGGVDLIHLIGYMSFLSHDFVTFNGRKTMNVHPALLPQAAGMMDLDIHKLMIDRRVKLTGDTIMFIDDGPDTGAIIWQESVMVLPGDTKETLKTRVQETEQGLIILATKLFMEDKLRIEGRQVIILDMSWQEVHEMFVKTMEEIRNYKSANQ